MIETIEDREDFMGDISFFLFKVHKSETKINCIDLAKYNNNYTNTIDRIRQKDVLKPVLVNYIRLLLLMNNCNKVGHIERSSSGLEGVAFSTIENRFHLLKKDFENLCLLENDDTKIIDFCKKAVFTKIEIQNIFDNSLDTFSVEKFIKSWLILKVANAEKESVCLAYYDGNGTGVAAYKFMDSNKLIENEDFSLSNSICGFAVKSGRGGEGYVHYTSQDFWLKPEIIDTPFSAVAFDPIYRIKEQIQKNQDKIDELIGVVANW